jgi:DNA polymerase elongation subunit (family B)
VVLRRLLSDRQVLKKEIVACTDETQRSILAGKELAVKVAANSACGALGEQTHGNPISHCELNDLITTTGRNILSLAKDVAENMGIGVLYGDTDSLFIYSQGRTREYIDTVHKVLPSGIRFKLEYTANKFIAGNKKHYVYMVDDQIMVKGYKSTKSSKCPAAGRLFMWLMGILMAQGPDVTQLAYETAVESYCNETRVDVKQLAHSYNYKGKDYSEKSHMKKLLSAMRSRGIDVVPGNTRYLVTVYTHGRYMLRYGVSPPIQLPSDSSCKAERLYDVDEVGNDASLVDIRTILDSQCYSDLSSILSAIRVGKL